MDVPGETAAIRAFEDANARRATPAERQLLRGLAERFDPIAQTHGDAKLTSGWAWVGAAVYEAVEAGSAFVAPRRLREILGRWEREGLPGGDAESDANRAHRRDGATASGEGRAARGVAPRPTPERPVAELLGAGPDLALPHGFGSRQTWAFTVGLLAGAVERERLVELVAGTAIVGYRDGEVTIAAPDAIQAERLASEYRDLVARKLGEAMRRPVRVAVLATRSDATAESGETQADATMDSALITDAIADDDVADEHEPTVPSFFVPECGLPSWQVWAAVLDEVRDAGDVSRANFDTWLRVTALIGREPDGTLVVGAPHALAQRRIEARFLPQLRIGVEAVAGARLPLRVVVAADWLRANPQTAPIRAVSTLFSSARGA